MEEIEEYERRKHFIVNDYMLNKVWDKIKETIDTDGQLPDNIILKYIVILITCVIKDNGKSAKFQLFLAYVKSQNYRHNFADFCSLNLIMKLG